MMAVAIVTRRLKEGKTYEDFRRVWFHTVGFGSTSKLYTMINAADPREITVIGFVETTVETFEKQLEIDINERLAHSLDDVIEPEAIDRKFGLLRAEDDFSMSGDTDYKPAMVSGQCIDPITFDEELKFAHEAMVQASNKRDRLKESNKTEG